MTWPLLRVSQKKRQIWHSVFWVKLATGTLKVNQARFMQVATTCTYLADRVLTDCVYIKPAHWAACSNIFERWNLSVSTCGIFPWPLLDLGLRPGRRGFQGGSVRLVKYWCHRLAHEGSPSPSCYSCQWCQLLSPMRCLIKPPTISWLSNGDHDADVVETQKKKWEKRSQIPPQAVLRSLILNPSFV